MSRLRKRFLDKPAKRVIKAWGVFVAGNETPDETFGADWNRREVARFYREHTAHKTTRFLVLPVTITYTLRSRRPA